MVRRYILSTIFLPLFVSSSLSAQARSVDLKNHHEPNGPTVPIATVKNLIHVPLVSQATNYTCGVAATESILFYYDQDEEYVEGDLAKALGADPNNGVTTDHILEFARSRGFTADRYLNMTLEQLLAFIDKGQPVMVLIQAWPEGVVTDWKNDWSNGHFVIAIGYDAERIYFMDPSTTANYAFIPRNEFLDRWHDEDGTTRVNNLGLVIAKQKPVYDDTLAFPIN